MNARETGSKLAIAMLGLIAMLSIGSSKALAEGATIDLRDNSGFGAAQGTLEWNINDIKATGALLAGGRGASLWLSWNALEKHK